MFRVDREFKDESLTEIEQGFRDFYVSVSQEEDYDISGSGLFAIIRNDEFLFEIEKGLEGLNYKWDQQCIAETFNLLNDDQNPKENVYIGENLQSENIPSQPSDLTPKNMFRNTSLESFMKAVRGYKVSNHPSFVMFFLMSHGEANGDFMLSNKEKTEEKECWRNVATHLIEPIQEIYKGIPKIFILQTCRGQEENDVLASDSLNAGEAPELKLEDYIPRSADTLILYPCAAGQVSYVWRKGAQRGSLLVTELMSAISDLGLRLSTYHDQQKMVEEMDAVASRYKQQHPLQRDLSPERPAVRLESLVNGWLSDICRIASGQVAQKYMWEKQYKLVSAL